MLKIWVILRKLREEFQQKSVNELVFPAPALSGIFRSTVIKSIHFLHQPTEHQTAQFDWCSYHDSLLWKVVFRCLLAGRNLICLASASYTHSYRCSVRQSRNRQSAGNHLELQPTISLNPYFAGTLKQKAAGYSQTISFAVGSAGSFRGSQCQQL